MQKGIGKKHDVAGIARSGKSFGEQEVLQNVTASVERGDRIGIIGANGTGKTTLLRILCGESLPDSGAPRLVPA